MEKVLVFTGAGISVPLGLPSTTDFISEVKTGIKPVTSHIMDYLGDAGGDIEWLLSTLESFGAETPLTEFLLPHIATDQHSKNGLRNLRMQLNALKSESTGEIRRIKKIIFDKLSQYENEKALELYTNLFSEIKSHNKDAAISLITTNYDLTFESAFEESTEKWDSIGIKDCEFNFSTYRGRPVYNSKVDFQWDNSIIEYLKIHGSLDWHRDTKGRCSRSGTNTIPDDPDQMVILYPGFKGVPETEPFISMHGRLNSRLMEADTIIVIGFAFRDSYINNIFENVLRIRPKVNIFLYNPLGVSEFPKDSSVKHFVNNYSAFKHIEQRIEVEETPLKLSKYLK